MTSSRQSPASTPTEQAGAGHSGLRAVFHLLITEEYRMYCQKCGKELPDQASFCPSCGHPARPETRSEARPSTMAPGYSPEKAVSPFRPLAAPLPLFLVGFPGVHRFYVGKIGTGVAMI